MPKVSAHTSPATRAALAHFAALLRIRRKERNLKLDELADRLGVSIPTVRKMLEGSPSVAAGTYFQAAHLLGVPLFDPDSDRLAATATRAAEIDALLPQRIRTRKVVIDDDF
ncbi:MAG: helix-turn-helix transcriptional regulator [Verrucomicrobiaceae bacterium]|nr:helix-turn-helix transcriptional regulator [Verrucomicrobiaceae bacterium]